MPRAPSGDRPAVVQVEVRRSEDRHPTHDLVVVEEPLEIRVDGQAAAVTMRTPGDDLDLAAGFLYTEGVIDGPDDLTALATVDDPRDPKGNTVDAVLAAGVPMARRRQADRRLYQSSSCGVCGKETLERVFQTLAPLPERREPDGELLQGAARVWAGRQPGFAQTGGVHAAALLRWDGQVELLREDVGRHNAVDKVLGARLRADRVPVDDAVLVVSGRAGFELVQKALVARVPALVAVGAPSSLAVELAQRGRLVLVGFFRDGRWNLYS